MPEDELWMGHEVGDALEHAAGLEDEGGEGDPGEVHADPELGDEGEHDRALVRVAGMGTVIAAVSTHGDGTDRTAVWSGSVSDGGVSASDGRLREKRPIIGGAAVRVPDSVITSEHDLTRYSCTHRDVLPVERSVCTVLSPLDRHREPSQPLGAEPALTHHPRQLPSQSPLVLLSSEVRDRLSTPSSTACEDIVLDSSNSSSSSSSDAPVRPIRWM